eukprot:TRINITY_DN3398_c0_g1_i1.p1 TRINITY_DN3398_c0_g1~~TRINITY_DN3398_c0_g1_i1.p1  ORF type:complete len:646 (+),score=286.02 TRINITY_DN3398_c0_g1_i1:203-1939(+)
MSASVNICSEIAKTVKELGFRGEIGYHHIIYPNPADTRSILLFLDDRRPKEQPVSDLTSQHDYVRRLAGPEISRQQKELWSPHFCLNTTARPISSIHSWPLASAPLTSPLTSISKRSHKRKEGYIREFLPFITQQFANSKEKIIPSTLEMLSFDLIDEQEREWEWDTFGLESGLTPQEYQKKKRSRIHQGIAEDIRSVLQSTAADTSAMGHNYTSFVQDVLAAEANSRKRRNENSEDYAMMKGTRFSHQVGFRDDHVEQHAAISKDPEMSQQEKQEAREKEIKDLDEGIESASNEISLIEKQMQSFSSSIKQMEAMLQIELNKTHTLSEELNIKEKTYGLLEDAEDNIYRLGEMSQMSANRLRDLAVEWEKHRMPLIKKYRAMKHAQKTKKDDTKELLAEIKKIREDMKEYSAELQKKDEKLKKAIEEHNALNKDVTRSSSTSRILEIVNNVKKQKVDIDKILIDTRNIKKEKSNLLDALGRKFGETSEKIFQDALKDPEFKPAYRDVANLNEKFKNLTIAVEETGNTKNGTLDLEVRIEKITQRAESMDSTNLLSDLRKVKAENQEMIARLKSMRKN